MIVVAIAGGFGDLGQQFSKALRDTGKYEIIVLKRQGSTSKEIPGFTVAEVDFSSVDALTEFLKVKNVHTVVSALGVHWKEASENQVNLIQAAEASKTVKRFLPAEYTYDYAKSNHIKSFYCKEFTDANRQALAKTNLEYTIVYTSQFMDYFGLPNIKTPMNGIYLLLDVPNKTAVLPGDGTGVLSCILTPDFAKFIPALLELPRWDPVYNAIGDSMTFNGLVEAAERATGSKFRVVHDSVEKLCSGSPTLLPGNEEIFQNWQIGRDDTIQFCAAISVGLAVGAGDVSGEGTNLNKLFPDIKTTKVEDYIRSCFQPDT
ncbi:hypothetical protein DL95DRAFT_425569 [Leptodontidium sp. 2 PMI_412]|nr:hypothetical protein DL95DRAFT_425569 [Leptodontidium sp. 2 PMI_412]